MLVSKDLTFHEDKNYDKTDNFDSDSIESKIEYLP